MVKTNTAKKSKQQIIALPGMGAVVQDKGVLFRVWAPHADKVFVTGTFNKWSEKANPLQAEENGTWAAVVSKAKAGDEYQFIIVNGRDKMWRIDPYAREVTNSAGNAVVFEPSFEWADEGFEPPQWNEMIIYEMHLGTFNRRDPQRAATFQDAIAKLDYLVELGINTIELMPTMEFPGGISWGYNPAYIYAVESDYGGPHGLMSFVNEAHKRDLAVIMDVVYNHFGPSDLDLWRFDGWAEGDWGGIYFYNDDRANTPWGATRPDYGREQVRRYIHDNAIMWLTEYHLDGLRFDATAYIRNRNGLNDPNSDIADGWGLLRWINDSIDEIAPGKLIIAEDLQGNEWLVKGTGAGGAGFDAQWSGEFVHTVRNALITPADEYRDIKQLGMVLVARYDNNAFSRIIYTESHDEVANGRARVPEEISAENPEDWFAKKRSMLGAGLVFTAPGIPMIFQGQEFLEDEWFQDQKPLDWEKLDRHQGIWRFYADLAALRQNKDGSTAGLTGQNVHVFHVNEGGRVIGFRRWFDENTPADNVVVILNFSANKWSDYRIGLPFPGRWMVRLSSDAQLYDETFESFTVPHVDTVNEPYDGFGQSGILPVAPYSVTILTCDEGVDSS